MWKTGACARSSAGADTEPNRRRSNHEWTDGQAGRSRLANTDADGGRRVHAGDGTPRKNAATRLAANSAISSRRADAVGPEWPNVLWDVCAAVLVPFKCSCTCPVQASPSLQQPRLCCKLQPWQRRLPPDASRRCHTWDGPEARKLFVMLPG